MARIRKDNDQRYLLKADGPFAKLDDTGKLDSSVLPPLAITETFVVANTAERLALTAQTGDLAIQADNGVTYILYGTNPAVSGDWIELSSSETDPVFTASPAFGITSTNITQWNTAYGWGNHVNAGYLKANTGGYSSTYSIPIVAGAEVYTGGSVTITGSTGTINTPSHGTSANWNTAYGWGDHASAGYVLRDFQETGRNLTINSDSTAADAGLCLRNSNNGFAFQVYGNGTDYGFLNGKWSSWDIKKTANGDMQLRIGSTLQTVWHTGTLTTTEKANWNTAYGWGNHASAGYLTSFDITSQTDPKYLRSDVDDTALGRITLNKGHGMLRQDGVYIYPNSFQYAAHWKFTEAAQLNSPPGSGSWRHVQTIQGWSQHSTSYPSWQMSFGNGAIGVRQSTSNTAWASWQTLLTSSNYTSYAPTLTGSGASGTWGISVTGNAATATSATSATTAGTCTGNAATATWADTVDVNSGNTSAAWYDVVWHSGDSLYSSTGVEIYANGSYLRAEYLNMTHASTTRNSDTIFFSSTDSYIRKNNASGFRSSLNVPTRTGGNASGTWGISITGSSASCTGNAATATTATNVTGISRNVGDFGSIAANTTRGGYYGLSCGGHLVLMSSGSAHGIYDDVNNDWWVRFYENAGVGLNYNGSSKLDTTSVGVSVTGSMTASGEVTAFSDARLKSDVKTLDGDKVYQMRGVSYTKDGQASSGVIAQELQEVAPELVHEGEEYLSVAYGNMVGYLIEAIKDLKAEVEELKRGNTDKQTSESVNGSD